MVRCLVTTSWGERESMEKIKLPNQKWINLVAAIVLMAIFCVGLFESYKMGKIQAATDLGYLPLINGSYISVEDYERIIAEQTERRTPKLNNSEKLQRLFEDS